MFNLDHIAALILLLAGIPLAIGFGCAIGAWAASQWLRATAGVLRRAC